MLEKTFGYTDNYSSLEEWIALRKESKELVYPQFCIPYKGWLEEYIENISSKSDEEVRELLRILLQPYTLGMDTIKWEGDISFLADIKNKEKAPLLYEMKSNRIKYNEKSYRLKNGQEAWEGLTWIIALLNSSPLKALNVLGTYFDAECMYMPDMRINGIYDAMSIIEAKYIQNASGKSKYILSLTSRDFEILIAALYKKMGYKVILTKVTRDGGKDIIAEINEYERKEKVLVECKLYKITDLKKETVRALGYVMQDEKATRATIFTTGYATKEMKEMDSRIQIFNLEEMIFLLNANWGEKWYTDFEWLKNYYILKNDGGIE